MKKFFEEFKKFALRGNVVDMAVGVIMGGAFGKIVASLVNDLLMPVLTLLTGGIDITNQFVSLNGVQYDTIAAAQEAGAATLNYGVFIQTVIDFVLVAFCIFLFVKGINRLHRSKPEAPAAPKPVCPFCLEEIKEGATRCPHCAAELPKGEKK